MSLRRPSWCNRVIHAVYLVHVRTIASRFVHINILHVMHHALPCIFICLVRLKDGSYT